MRILKTYSEAIKVVKPYLPTVKQFYGPYEQSLEAAEHTLKYIFKKLHHSCYLLCVKDDMYEFVKLESEDTSPSFRKTIRQKIRDGTRRRVMQCIVKPYSKVPTFTKEYDRFFKELSSRLPNGVFLMNLTDAVLLRKDRKEPWPMVTGDVEFKKYNYETHLPILGGSGAIGYWDIPIPNYDDIRYVLGYDKVGSAQLDWNSKKPIAVFRGSPTGCGYTPETNMRIKLAMMQSGLINAGLTFTKSNTYKFDPKQGLGMTNLNIPPAEFMTFEEQSSYKYILHIDGNVAAYRLLKMMLTGSLILKVKGKYTLWGETYMEEGKHYVEVKEDLSDLEEVIKWCIRNDAKCKKIAEAGFGIAKELLTKERVENDMISILNSVSYVK